MGINIFACKVTGVIDKQYLTRKWKELITEEYKDWDYLRHSGDREFMDKINWVVHPDVDDSWEEPCYRPNDIPAAKKWLQETNEIHESDKPRLLKLLDDMEKDESIYVSASY